MADHEAQSRPRIRVLHSFKAPRSETTYAVHMTKSARPEVTTLYFSWRTAIFGQYDVLHLHWPEYLVRGRGRRDAIQALVKVPALLVRLAITRAAVVRTLHNLQPHEQGHPFENTLLRALDRRTNLNIRLNPVTDSGDTPVETILHGHYKDQFAEHHKPDPQTGNILYFGMVRPYKGIEHLIEVFTSSPDETLRLRIVGRPNRDSLRETIESAGRTDSRVSSRLEFVPDADLVAEIGSSELVVLPYKEMQNSGSLLVALSMGRPVLAPRSDVNEAIVTEVGNEWLYLYDGDLTLDILMDALAQARSTAHDRAESPEMAERSWDTVGELHYAAYLRALSLARAKSRAVR